jgi:hypothetical protein
MELLLPDYGMHSGCMPFKSNSEGEFISFNNNSNEQRLDVAIDNLYIFLDFLEYNGMPRSISNTAIKRMAYYLDIDHDPRVADILELRIPRGLGFVNNNSNEGGLSDSELELIDAAFVAMGAEPGFGKKIMEMIPSGFLESTFGSVFANGFDLSCWNVSSSPAEAARWFEQTLTPYFQNKMAEIQRIRDTSEMARAFSVLDKELKAIEAHQLFHKGKSKSSCSRKGNQHKADAARSLYTTMRSEIDKLPNIITKEVPFEASSVRPEGISINWKGTRKTINHTLYSFSPTKQNKQQNTSISPVSKASMGIGSMLLLGGLLVGSFYAGKSKKESIEIDKVVN